MKTKAQRSIFWSGLALFILLGLFPPWREKVPDGIAMALTNSFISAPPDPRPFPGSSYIPRVTVEVDVARLLIEWMIISVLTGGIIVGLGSKQKEKTNPPGFR